MSYDYFYNILRTPISSDKTIKKHYDELNKIIIQEFLEEQDYSFGKHLYEIDNIECMSVIITDKEIIKMMKKKEVKK